MTDPDYVRQRWALLFDLPAALASDPARANDTLNGIVDRITALIEADPALQRFMRQAGVELGWEAGSWEDA